ncbi:MAG TPA: 2Fe-2S iron-sulfur cluster-binding protein, partial [Anaerolineaceae bacterium]|nr:2Fe-2S iron-sulfur cluster-binding protein [Anaerolineaceae bacterium]
MSELFDVQLTVNGQVVQRTVPADMTLMNFLRGSLGLTGVKNGCAEGHCGTCTVIFNGKAERSCLISMRRAHGSVVETVEDLAPAEDRLHPLQYAFAVENATQCGFCTPGMLMAGKALLNHTPTPSEAEIRHALRHNLCRCTGYTSIVRAVQRAAEMLAAGVESVELPPAGEAANGQGLLGVELLDKNAVAAVRGEIRYGADRAMDGMLYGKIKWAEVPSARVVNIDDRAALRVPGVRLVLTGRDVLGTNQVGQL